ncbi:MAG: ABC transporter ATP-binding protein/permease [Clostridiales bacterium]|nr:ABC transporter ATP-binding protein/permease [Clostridiales bacterium]
MITLLKKMRRREKLMALLCIILVLGQVYFDLAMPDYMSDLTVMIQTPGSEQSEIWSVGGKMLGCALCSMALAVIAGYFAAQTAAGFSYAVREEIFDKVSSFGKQEMNGFSVPSLIVRTTNDVTQIQMLIAMGLQILIKAPVMAVWAVIKIVNKSWELSVLTACFVVFLLSVMIFTLIVLLPRFRKVQRQTDDINRIAREDLNGIGVVHAFNAEEYQNRKFSQANDALTNTQLFNQRTFAALMPLMSLGMSALSLGIYWLGASLIENIPVTDIMARIALSGDVVVFSTYATFVVMSLMMIVMIFMMLPAAQVSAVRINEILKTEPAVKEGKREEGTEQGTLEFRNVSFQYPDSSHPVLKDISFQAKRGETVAFIGATGSGKTTLVSLAARFFDATAGQVLLDGEDIREYSFKALYDRLGYVTQKAVLFSGSVEENVNFGESDAAVSDENTWEALSVSQAAEFVERMPEKLGEKIGIGGGNLSGGQKQRISIARALARKPEILIFDDSFSALDYKTDARLRQALEDEFHDTTKLIVAQRIGTIKNADKIVVLDHGRAVGIGRHEELMENCPVYREIALSQLSARELGDKEENHAS